MKKSPINGGGVGLNLTPGKGVPHVVHPSSRILRDDDEMVRRSMTVFRSLALANLINRRQRLMISDDGR